MYYIFVTCFQGRISESAGTFLYCINLMAVLCFPSATVHTLTSMTPGTVPFIYVHKRWSVTAVGLWTYLNLYCKVCHSENCPVYTVLRKRTCFTPTPFWAVIKSFKSKFRSKQDADLCQIFLELYKPLIFLDSIFICGPSDPNFESCSWPLQQIIFV